MAKTATEAPNEKLQSMLCAIHLKSGMEVPAVTMYLGHTLCAECTQNML